jgi:hypothetical protein
MKIIAASIALVLFAPNGAGAAPDKPKLALKANPAMAFSPARIVFTGELTGIANDNQEFYCPSVEWEWGDGTKSEESADCEPYQAGKSEIKRHFTTDHTYRIEEPPPTVLGGQPTEYHDIHVQLRLRKNGKVIASAGTTVKIKGESDAPVMGPAEVPGA